MATAYERYMVVAASRRKKALAMREKGHTLQQIATKMGVSRQRVAQWLERERK